MGTRSLTIFKDDDGEEIAILYRQFDGYPDIHGKELSEFLKGSVIVNGLSKKDKGLKVFNGMDCLAASVVAHFKTGPGGFYLYPAGAHDCNQDYTYTVSGKIGSEPTIHVCKIGSEPTIHVYKGLSGTATEVYNLIVSNNCPEDKDY